MSRPPLFLLLGLPACVATQDPTKVEPRRLQTGMYVEAKGTPNGNPPRVTEVDVAPREADDKADKVELTGPVEQAAGDRLRLLGAELVVDEETEHEGRDRTALPPFVAAPGEWLRVKARWKDERLRARLLRRMDPRDQWKVLGEVLAVDQTAGTADVGGIRLALPAPEQQTAMQRSTTDPLTLFLADDQKTVPFSVQLTDSLLLGGQAAVEWERNYDYDLQPERERDRTKPAVRGRVDALWRFGEHGSYALGEITFGRSDTWRENGEDTHVDVLEVTRAFASLRGESGITLLAGRQDFVEAREWLYDEILDGARLIARSGSFDVELAWATGREALAEDNSTEDTGLFVANTTWTVDDDWSLDAYAVKRTDDTAADHEPLLYGLRSYDTPRFGLGHWLELGGAAGSSAGRDLRGFAVDAGVLLAFDLPWRPSVGGGFAFGSGAGDDARRGGYRQTGLQDNNARLGGVTGVRYYGELFDPELANLAIATVFAAVRPWPNTSISLLGHTYRQDEASTAVPTHDLRTQPSGQARDLGRELDLVLAYRVQRRLTVELVAGWFDPGEAFPGGHTATLLAFTTRLSF